MDHLKHGESETTKAPVTVVRTKYRTLSPTFTGEVGGYTTVKKDSKETTTTPRAVTTTPKAKETPKPTEDPDDSDPTTQTEPTIATDRGLSSSAATGTPLPISTQSTLPDSSSGGSGAGAKAGIAIGVIAGILVIAGLVFFLFKRKKKNAARQSLEDDEKLHGAFNSGNYAPTAAAAAAVSAAAVASGPATGGNLNQEKPLGGFAAAPVPFNRGQPQPQHHQSRSNGSGWERPSTSQSQQNPNNPFGTHAELSGSQPPSPQSGAPIAAAAAVAGGAAAYQGLKRQASRNHGPAALDLTITPPPLLQAVPPSPAGTEYSVSSITPGQQVPNSSGAAVIAAAGGPAGSTVHRVQLDFKPTMDDELDLKAGQLVRLLHEYDDGWALCIRLDRSRQGVVPRTCLSTRPVKPRAPGGPNGQQRMGPPVNPQPHPMHAQKVGPAPLQVRPESPARSGTPSGPNYYPQQQQQQQQQQSSSPRYQPMPPPQRSGTPNSMNGRSSPALPRTMSPAPGPLSAPIPAPMATHVPAPITVASIPPVLTQGPVSASSPVVMPGPMAPAAPLAAVVEVPSPAASPSLPPVLAPIPLSAPLAGPEASAEAPQPVTSPSPSVGSTASPASPASPASYRSGPPTSGSISRKPVPGQAM
ncbi:unnamed protein product [Parascedosporium putredinis]|uniref:SH3 domain-containing protein n=1 Tax=Parascedosporium putredinis TaxID=1442378 RepID=A0A9P1H3Y3_9PEZI|nr:unnamed protein product [Parascedosporium putredinis]CAI7995140.1 unnamed protein product [Parascedosporium putredinis]